MQTIDAIRRTSELSKVLKQNGLAEDSIDAVSQSRGMPNNESSRILEPERIDSSSVMQKIANLERSKHLLAGRVDQLHAEIAAQNAAFKQLVARLDGAESRLRHLQMQPAVVENSQIAPAVSAEPAQQQAAPFQVTSSRPEPVAQVAERPRHPRQAAMDEKFSIENIFYCGAK